MNEQVYRGLLNALGCISNPMTDPKTREQAEVYVESFKETDDSVDYALHILTVNDPAHTDFVKHFCFNCLKINVVAKWKVYSIDRKNRIKEFAVSYLKNFINDSTPFSLYVITKFAEVFVELMKREWPQYWGSLYDELKNNMRKSGSQFVTGIIIFEYLLQEMNDKSVESRLTESRRNDLRQEFNRLGTDFIRFNLFTMKNYLSNPNIAKEIIMNCVKLFTSVVPSVNESILSETFDMIVDTFSPFLSNQDLCDELLPEYLQFYGNLTKYEYSQRYRDFGIKVIQTLLNVYPSIQSFFPDISVNYEVYKNYYLAVIDFCTYQKTVFASWKNNETSIYQSLLQQVLSIIAFPRLEIADFALDALPLLYPNIQRSEYRNIKSIAEESIVVLFQNLLTSIQSNNINNPQFNSMNYIDYDEDNSTDYQIDYGEYVNMVSNRLVSLSSVYYACMVKAILTILQTQYRDDPIFIDALLKIIGAVNRGIQKYNDQMRIQSDIIQNGKLIIEKFMSFPMGQNGQSDVYTLDFIYSFLWVLKSDTTVLVSVMRYLLNLINSVTTFYNGNEESQAAVSKTASFQLHKICFYYGSSLISQLREFMSSISQLLSQCKYPTTVTNLSMCYLCLASNGSVGDQRLKEFATVFSRVINYLNNPELVALFSDPVKFHTTFNTNLAELANVLDSMTCLVSMFDAVTTTSEYCSLVKEVFSVLNQPMLSLFSTLSYLLVGNGSEEPEASVWRWITPSEVGIVKFTSTIPLQSTRLYSLFIQLTKLWRHFANCEEAINDYIITQFESIFQQFFPFYRLSMITTVIENMILPFYLSYAPSWQSAIQTASPAVSQLLYTVISNSINRLMNGENTRSMQSIGISLPNETPEKSFALGSEMISENLAIRCSESLILLLNGMIGYTYKDYRNTFALRQFSYNLIHGNRDFAAGVKRINNYMNKGSQLPKEGFTLKDNEDVRKKCVIFCRSVFEHFIIQQEILGNVVNQLVSMFVSSTSSSLAKQILNFCSIYIPYLGGRSVYASFLDSLFEVGTMKIINGDNDDELLNKRLLTINTYIFGFNVIKRNLSGIHTNEKQIFTSNIDQFLGASGLVTTSMYESLVNKMKASKSDSDCVEILKDFYIEMKNSGDGSQSNMNRLDSMIDVPRTAINKNKKGKGKNGKQNNNHSYNQKDNRKQYKQNRKNKRKQQHYQQKNQNNVFGDEKVDDDTKDMFMWN